ncbi:MAG: PepSY-like domain-containing protein [Bacteroidetes bacterium]|nr:PepSY-like domain-containing protein [Bacteroidota bacterium]
MKTLKSLILAAAMGMISYQAIAQRSDRIPLSVTTDFASKYPGVKVRNWEAGNDQYVASFRLNGRQCEAYYAKDGAWRSTEVIMRHLKNLSPDIRKALRDSKYASYHIDGVKRLHMPNSEMFIVEVDNNSGNKMIYDNLGSFDDQLLYFTVNGKLVKTVNNANE